MWLYAVLVAYSAVVIANEVQLHYTVVNPGLVHFRLLSQVAIAAISLAVSLFSWIHHKPDPLAVRHGGLMCGLWMTYALIGLIPYTNMQEWKDLDHAWMIAVILLFCGWIFALRFPPRAPERPRALQSGQPAESNA